VTWVHWVLYNIPAATPGLPEAVKATALPAGTREGQNDWGRAGYRGPCPPIGRHRYFHKLYALDVVLPPLARPDRSALEKAMQGLHSCSLLRRSLPTRRRARSFPMTP
jgi:Raf kinase inhibitor-like YbhB/YbcL family protein